MAGAFCLQEQFYSGKLQSQSNLENNFISRLRSTYSHAIVIAVGVIMAHHRSPNCPQISFAEAIEKGRKVYEKEHTHPAARLVIAGDLGYSGMNGRSLTLIGALRQYAILEGSGDAMRVTKDAVAYYEMDDGTEKDEAVRRMVFSPPLFAELNEQFKEKLPSDGNLRHTLVTKGFSTKAAEDVIAVYKANVTLVSGEEPDYIEGEVKPPMNPGLNSPPPAPLKPIPGVQTYAFALSPNARAELSLRGEVTSADLALLRAHIDLTIQALGGAVRPPAKDETKQ